LGFDEEYWHRAAKVLGLPAVEEVTQKA
jgi:hypothetical protein